MLTLDGRVKSPKRVTEKSFEDAYGKAIHACGIKNWHMSSREAGWPDRYLTGGIWIEFKVLEKLENDQLEPEQKARMRELAAAGNPVWYIARYGDEIIVTRYPFKRPLAKVDRFFYRTKTDLEWSVNYHIKGQGHAQKN
jgi:hypothetical protein